MLRHWPFWKAPATVGIDIDVWAMWDLWVDRAWRLLHCRWFGDGNSTASFAYIVKLEAKFLTLLFQFVSCISVLCTLVWWGFIWVKFFGHFDWFSCDFAPSSIYNNFSIDLWRGLMRVVQVAMVALRQSLRLWKWKWRVPKANVSHFQPRRYRWMAVTPWWLSNCNQGVQLFGRCAWHLRPP